MKNNTLVDSNLANQPEKGIIITSAIKEADITYDICSTLAPKAPCRSLKEELTIWTLITFSIKPTKNIMNIKRFFLYIIFQGY